MHSPVVMLLDCTIAVTSVPANYSMGGLS